MALGFPYGSESKPGRQDPIIIRHHSERELNLIINGDDYHDLPEGMTVRELLLHLELPEKKIAVERNREIVPKSGFAATALTEGDQLEIIHFIGGG